MSSLVTPSIFTLFFVISLVSLLFLETITGQVPKAEVTALFQLHSNTNGNDWRWKDEVVNGPKWNFTRDSNGNFVKNPCSSRWQGITCSSTSPALCASQPCRIIAIKLPGYKMTGRIPSEMGNIVFLRQIEFDNNALTGPIPSAIFNLLDMRWLSLSNNDFSGSVPSNVNNPTKLEYLFLHRNFLTGTIPSAVGTLVSLKWLSVSFNFLTGSVPTEVYNLVNLGTLLLHENFFTGPITSDLGNFVLLKWLSLGGNSFSGTIPKEIGNLVNLELLYSQSNLLTGPIPSEMGNLVHLQLFFLFDNALTGSLPQEMRNMALLQFVSMRSNMLVGGITDVFNASLQVQLEALDLSDNALTGSYGDDIFRLPAIRILALSVNCFEAELPNDMCEARSLEVLSLNGLGAAEGCTDQFKFPISGVVIGNAIGGTLPDCVWHLPKLSVLHSVGNELTGKLVPSLKNTSRLKDMSLSHNMFTGAIPIGIEKVRRVDLSHNQFSHKYLDHHEGLPHEMLNLEINRLSGHLPASKLENVNELSVLRGNIFSCDSIPMNDEYEHDYVCGSADLNESLYVFSAALVTATCAMVAIVVLWSLASEKVDCPKWMAPYVSRLQLYLAAVTRAERGDEKFESIVTLCAKLKTVVKLFAQLLGVIMLVAIPIYSVRGSDEDEYSTHSNTYAWFWTLAYMRGTVPAALVLAAWSIALGVCFYRIMLFPLLDAPRRRAQSLKTKVDLEYDDEDDDPMLRGKKMDPWIKTGVLLLNAVVSITVNSLYIHSLEQPLPPILHFGNQLALAIFRLIYSYCIIPFLFQSIVDPVANIYLWMRVLIVDTLAIPCLVTAFASPSCFQGLLIAADSVSTPFTFEQCVMFQTTETGPVCVAWETVQAESAPVTPPFVYNNQCASVMLTSFVPVLIIGFSIQLASTLVIPVLYYHLGKVVDLSQYMVSVLWPEVWLDAEDPERVNLIKKNLKEDPIILINLNSIMCIDVLNNAMIMLTFGMCSPVLALAVACVVALKMNMLVLVVGRFTAVLRGDDGNSSSGDSSEEGMHFALATLCAMKFPLTEILRHSFWLFAWSTAVFFVIICWDMAGDEVSLMESLWVPFWALCYPLLLWGIFRYSKYRLSLSFPSVSQSRLPAPAGASASLAAKSQTKKVNDVNDVMANGSNPLHDTL